MDPQPIPYATPARKGVPPLDPSTDVLTAATVGWRTAVAAAWLAGVLAAAAWAVATLYDQQQGAGVDAVLTPGRPPPLVGLAWALAGPVAFAVGVGAVAAVVLYHWTVGRLAWVATLPAVAGVGSAFGAAASINPPVLGLLATAAVQAGLVYAGTHLGRPVARWLARRLVPPPLRPSLIALWL